MSSSSNYIYKAYDYSDRQWHYLDSLGGDYYSKREKISISISKELVDKIDKYRGPVGLSRSRYVEYVINEHFSDVD